MVFARQLKPKRGKIMTTKLLKGALTRIAATAIAAVFFTPVASAATSSGDMDNPVTGETKTYDYKYVGSGTWTASDWQDANGAALAAAPGTDNSNLWGSMLVNCSDPISVAQLNGWELQLGVFGGANVTVGELGYWTGSESCFAAVDNASSLTISATTGKNWNNTVKFYVANRSGITFTSAFAPANPNGTGNINYYLKGSGSVTYSDSLGGGVGHVIKQADITLSGTSQIAYKPLVSFTSTTKTFTADAIIKRLNSSGTDLGNDARLTSVPSGYTTTLTTADSVGTCQLVQTSTGIDLYWVDGDPANLPAATVYKPSININFTHDTALTTSADVGLGEYAIPGTSWNNLVGNNGSLSALNAADSSGATWATAASVTISGTRGSWRCNNLTAASDLRQGYIDEEAGNPTPTVTVSGIPFEKYRVVVYTATDTANVKFGYITINGKNYTYVGDALTEGTTSWGASGAKDSAEPIAEGTNVLVSTVMLGSTLTVVGHRSGNDRGCIAAIQIVEYVPEIGENDLKIIVPGDTTYTVNETKELSGTVYVVGSGTLTLNGSAKITAATIDVGPNVTMNVNADRLDGTTFAGSGTVVYDGTAPATGKGWTDSDNWAGTVWLKNYAIAGLDPGDFANARSTLRLSLCTGYFNNGDNTKTCAGTLDLQNDTGSYAFSVDNGWSTNGKTIFAKLTGSGTLGVQTKDIAQRYVFKDASGFTGTVNLAGRPLRVIFGDGESLSPEEGSITVATGATVTIASGKTWTANKNGFAVNGTLNVDGTLASSHTTKAVSGSGTVVFTGREPTPTGNAWWKNSAWTGTVEIKNATLAKNIHLADYGNTGSKVCMNGSSAYLHVQSTGNHDIGELIIGSDGFTQGGLYSSGTVSIVLPCKVTGTGTYSLTASGGALKTVSLKGDLSEFNGALSATGNNCRFVVGSTTRTFATGSIVVGSDKVLKIAKNINPTGGLFVDEGGKAVISGDGFVWTSAGITADGVVSVTSLGGNIGGGTAVTVGDSGVFEVTRSDSSTNDDGGTDYSRVTGTGIIRFAGDGFTVISQSIPTALTFAAEKANGSVVPIAGATIGSLTGSKGFRSDWGNNGEGGRYLTIKQSTDTVWDGSICVGGAHRLTGVIVDPGASSTGTLTMTATQTASSTLTVNGSVNLTGTWVGATTVAGTFGGTGTLSGNLTLTDGATFKVDDATKYFKVSGGLTAGSGTITVDLPAGTKTTFPDGVKLMDVTGTITTGATFKVRIGGVEKSSVVVKMKNGSLKAVSLPGTKIIFR